MLGKLSALQIAMLVSVAVHGVLLSVRFVDPERFNRIFEDTPLEVILVNSRSPQAPDLAQAIAQATLAGGGESDRGRATSPLLPSPQAELGDAEDESRKQIEQLKPATRRSASRTNAGASCCACWPRSRSASTRRTPGRRSATSARPRARRSMRSTTTSCVARSRSEAPATSPNRAVASCTAS